MSTARLLWFFVWRTVLWGATLCALLAAAYIVLGITVSLLIAEGPGDGTPVGAGLAYLFLLALFFGVLGALLGSVLGSICGIALFGLTRALFRSPIADPRRYRRAAGRTCAAATALVLLVDWFANGYPNTEDFGLLRLVGNTNAPPQPTTPGVLLLVVLPALMLSLLMRLSGRLVAGRYSSTSSTAPPRRWR